MSEPILSAKDLESISLQVPTCPKCRVNVTIYDSSVLVDGETYHRGCDPVPLATEQKNALPLHCFKCSVWIDKDLGCVWVSGQVYHESCRPDVEHEKPESVLDRPASDLKNCVARLGSESATAIRVAQNLIANGWVKERTTDNFGPMDCASRLIDCITESL